MKKIIYGAVALAAMVATVSVAMTELASAERSEMLLKSFGFLSLILIDIYLLVSIFRNEDSNDGNETALNDTVALAWVFTFTKASAKKPV